MSLPPGAAGTKQTLKIMRQLVRRYKKELPIRQLALSVIQRVPHHKNFIGQIKALHNFVQNRIKYVRDINGVETVQTPLVTIENRAGDCDDQSVLLAALLESIGHPTRFVAIKTKPFGPYVHVFTETRVGLGNTVQWMPLETTEKWPAGKGPPKFSSRMVVHNR